MSHTVVRKEIEETPVLFQRDRIRRDEIAAALSRILPAVLGYANEAGIPLAGPPFLRCETSGPGLLSIQAGLPVAASSRADGEIEVGMLPGGPVAFTLHVGPYEKLPSAYAAIEKWLEEEGLESAGAPWESYVTDPGEVPDPAEWQTEIYWPLEPLES